MWAAEPFLRAEREEAGSPEAVVQWILRDLHHCQLERQGRGSVVAHIDRAPRLQRSHNAPWRELANHFPELLGDVLRQVHRFLGAPL